MCNEFFDFFIKAIVLIIFSGKFNIFRDWPKSNKIFLRSEIFSDSAENKDLDSSANYSRIYVQYQRISTDLNLITEATTLTFKHVITLIN